MVYLLRTTRITDGWYRPLVILLSSTSSINCTAQWQNIAQTSKITGRNTTGTVRWRSREFFSNSSIVFYHFFTSLFINWTSSLWEESCWVCFRVTKSVVWWPNPSFPWWRRNLSGINRKRNWEKWRKMSPLWILRWLDSSFIDLYNSSLCFRTSHLTSLFFWVGDQQTGGEREKVVQG